MSQRLRATHSLTSAGHEFRADLDTFFHTSIVIVTLMQHSSTKSMNYEEMCYKNIKLWSWKSFSLLHLWKGQLAHGFQAAEFQNGIFVDQT